MVYSGKVYVEKASSMACLASRKAYGKIAFCAVLKVIVGVFVV